MSKVSPASLCKRRCPKNASALISKNLSFSSALSPVSVIMMGGGV